MNNGSAVGICSSNYSVESCDDKADRRHLHKAVADVMREQALCYTCGLANRLHTSERSLTSQERSFSPVTESHTTRPSYTQPITLKEMAKMKRKSLIYGPVILVAVVAWAAFRPERLFVNAKVNETMPAVGSSNSPETILSSGTFHSVAHNGSGNASIYQLSDGKRTLRFTNFQTSNGPDVVAANDATDSESVKEAGFREIGTLKGNIGDQNYEIPSDVDLAKYHAVTIWCQRFGVNFATAPLTSRHEQVRAL
jgi:hypothetical protein